MNKTPETTLPPLYLSRMREELQDEFPLFLKSYERPLRQGLRVNTLKITSAELFELLPFSPEEIPDAPDCFFYPEDSRPGLSPYHEAGLYYIQEPSAMTVAAALQAMPGDRVLDLCAAPGGKTTAVAADMKGRGLLIANEISQKRAVILSQNIERMGITNAVVTNHAPEELSPVFSGFFDKILVDAPCSGEGMFRKEPQAIELWSPENIALCADRQDMILDNADIMLRPGGRLVYSTCTFSEDEDELCIERFLNTHPGYELLYMKKLLPHRFPGEGQFLAVLKKTGSAASASEAAAPRVTHKRKNAASGKTAARQSESRLKDAISAFMDFKDRCLADDVFFPDAASDLYINFGDTLYLLPERLPLTGLRVLRPGLRLGSMLKDRFEPSHSLALALSKDAAKNTVLLDQAAATQYIGGLSVASDSKNGWNLVCVDGCSLGFGKVSGGVCKNHYPKGLRRKTVAI